MAGNNTFATPESSDDFEAMCHQLYSLVWNDPGCMRVGRSGQSQFGVDILAFDGTRNVGIQCKHYTKTKFTIATVQGDVQKADDANLQIGHLLFATTTASEAEIVRQVHELSTSRRASGKFTVSVAFWGDICGHIRVHPTVGKSFIPNYPGGTILKISEESSEILSLVRDVSLKLNNLPGASGTEVDRSGSGFSDSRISGCLASQ
ncbi:hypothetical protein GTP23_13205 [Pseudoduganella sp. FT93W]|uniref:Restriction endonuclease type IV Mrr domain-containing protein n=1 Tax=Duganella fentianensis TaxID=2692177 RepID=A0A845I1P3_9BURK|nr:restriction endonuclease [Duganella fentianensis]MYN46007.1 hypothetical protein [Duganella fentianensis]